MRDDAQARQFLAGLLEAFDVAPTSTAAAKHALRLPTPDFEDALQAVAAIEAGADVIVTRDESGYRGLPVAVQSPSTFVESL